MWLRWYLLCTVQIETIKPLSKYYFNVFNTDVLYYTLLYSYYLCIFWCFQHEIKSIHKYQVILYSYLFIYLHLQNKFKIKLTNLTAQLLMCIVCYVYITSLKFKVIFTFYCCSLACLLRESKLQVKNLQKEHTGAFPECTWCMWASQPFLDVITLSHWGQLSFIFPSTLINIGFSFPGSLFTGDGEGVGDQVALASIGSGVAGWGVVIPLIDLSNCGKSPAPASSTVSSKSCHLQQPFCALLLTAEIHVK